MLGRILRVRGIIPVILILAAFGYWRLHPGPPKFIAIGYVADRDVPLWNTLAQVRERVGDLHYGERVEIVRQEGTSAQIRTRLGALGWLLDTRQLMDPPLWEQSNALLARARAMPVQARGQTKTVSNVRAEPGRNGRRIFQFTRGTQVLVLDRTIADAPPARVPALVEVLQKLGGAISTEEMRKLNYEVDGAKRDKKVVVREWLKAKGLN